MTHHAVGRPAFQPQRVSSGLLAVVLLIGGGCVSQQTFDRTRAEADELERTLETERLDLRALDERIASLHALNKQEDAATAGTRAAIQRELETAPIRRRQAEEKLAALQTQMAHLINQNRAVKREMAEAKQERASLQAMVSQYKQELEETAYVSPITAAPPAPSAVAPISPAATPPTLTSPATPTVPQPSAQTTAEPPVKPVTTIRPKSGQAPEDDSWTGLIKGWVSTVWEWIFG